MPNQELDEDTKKELSDFIDKNLEKHVSTYLRGQEELITALLEHWKENAYQTLIRYMEEKHKVVDISTRRDKYVR